MVKKLILSIFIFVLPFGLKTTFADNFSLSIFPKEIFQGDPILIQVNGITEISSIKKLTFGVKKLNIFMYQSKPSALYGVDLIKKVGDYEIKLELSDGTMIKKTITISKTEQVAEPLGIPDKLGGNTKESQDKLIATLVAEKKIMSAIPTNTKKIFWTDKFIEPLKEIFITDPYGYSRKTGEYSIAHKGTDYRAKEGTEVMAVNRGVVRIVNSYRNYGKTIVIDHGMGLMSFYLHLSKYKVKKGDIVERGQVIGLAGATGYAYGAHLHLGMRINDVAIDPVKFFDLFK